MRIRNGFVSNSSSSSFVIEKKWLSPHQIELIHHHIAKGKQVLWETLGGISKSDAWAIHETEDTIEGSTIMDNFDMRYYLKEIVKVNMDKVEYDDCSMASWHWEEEWT